MRVGANGGISFDKLYDAIQLRYPWFYSKEYIIKIVDLLFQKGIIYQESPCVYAYLQS